MEIDIQPINLTNEGDDKKEREDCFGMKTELCFRLETDLEYEDDEGLLPPPPPAVFCTPDQGEYLAAGFRWCYRLFALRRPGDKERFERLINRAEKSGQMSPANVQMFRTLLTQCV